MVSLAVGLVVVLECAGEGLEVEERACALGGGGAIGGGRWGCEVGEEGGRGDGGECGECC